MKKIPIKKRFALLEKEHQNQWHQKCLQAKGIRVLDLRLSKHVKMFYDWLETQDFDPPQQI